MYVLDRGVGLTGPIAFAKSCSHLPPTVEGVSWRRVDFDEATVEPTLRPALQQARQVGHVLIGGDLPGT